MSSASSASASGRLQPVAGVDQEIDALQVRPAPQIVAAKVLEPLHRLLARAGEAVAGQVDQAQPLVQHEQVDLAGAAGLVGGAGQAVAADQGVDQARLADVGAAGEGDLRQVGRGQLLDLGRAHQEAAVSRRRAPAPPRSASGVKRRRRRVAAHRSRRLAGTPGGACGSRAMKLSIGFSVLKRCMITYCCMIDRSDRPGPVDQQARRRSAP